MPATTAALLDLDPDLGEQLTDPERRRAARALAVRTVDVPTGSWRPATMRGRGGQGVSLLVVGGLALREVVLGPRVAGDVAGPGDLIDTCADETTATGGLPINVRWRVLQPLRVAVIGPRTLAAAAVLPGVLEALLERRVGQADDLARRLVLNQLVRLEDRLLLAVWVLADRWGCVRPDGVLLPWPLSHGTLGSLVGARRPSVTSTTGILAEQGVLRRTEDGWLLPGGAAETLAPLLERVRAPAA